MSTDINKVTDPEKSITITELHQQLTSLLNTNNLEPNITAIINHIIEVLEDYSSLYFALNNPARAFFYFGMLNAFVIRNNDADIDYIHVAESELLNAINGDSYNLSIAHVPLEENENIDDSDGDDQMVMSLIAIRYDNPNIENLYKNSSLLSMKDHKSINIMDAEIESIINSMFIHSVISESNNMKIFVVPFEISLLGFERFNELLGNIYNWVTESSEIV